MTDAKPLTDEEIKDFSEAFANYDGPSIPENFEFIRRLLATIDALRAENERLKAERELQ